ncbi:MAG: glutamine--fructose-6-phosphate transaminase (isomerizing) [Christensenellales bacterium]
MCGIVGYTGKEDCVSVLLSGLKLLEYRGYDSAGIAVMKNGVIDIVKRKGKVSRLDAPVRALHGKTGIGHTRWATHGKPSDVNSHPHKWGKFAVVHNGIIENFKQLKQEFESVGERFLSSTDTEVIVHLLNRSYKGDFLQAVRETVSCLQGSFALAILCEDCPDSIVVVKRESPLVIGRGKSGNYVSSDVPSVARYTKDIYIMENDDIAILTPDSVRLFDKNGEITENRFRYTDVSSSALDKKRYPHYMLKEINEIPSAICDTMDSFGKGNFPEGLRERLLSATNITIVACGTAYHSGICAKYLIEKLTRKPVNVDMASEFRYREPIVDENSVVLAISQSGETADTIAAVRHVKKKGAFVCAITNVDTSTIVNEADCFIHTKAGPEIAVAASKSYNTQLVVLYYIAYVMAGREQEFLDAKDAIVAAANEIISNSSNISKIAKLFKRSERIFCLGRNLDFATSLEAALKLKEITYIMCEGYASGELKHGPLALIRKNTPVIVYITQKELAEKTMNGLHEVKSRGARVILLTQYDNLDGANCAECICRLPALPDELMMPIVSIIPLQMLAYFISLKRRIDPDKPVNLAKSVTVE